MQSRIAQQIMKLNSNIILTLTVLASLQVASAQEKLPREEALRYANAVSRQAKLSTGTPLTTDVDLQQPVAIREDDYGAMLLPQKSLNAESLRQLTDGQTVPIGQLWLHKLTPMRNGSAISSDKLRLVSVSADGDEVTVPQCVLAVRRKNADALELLIFGKGKEPLVVTPLKKSEKSALTPLDLSAERQSESGRITVNVLGKYQASFDVTELES